MVAVLLGAHHSAQEARQGKQSRRGDERYWGRRWLRLIDVGDGAREPADPTVGESDDKTGIGVRRMYP
jgi:hypothetical protein